MTAETHHGVSYYWLLMPLILIGLDQKSLPGVRFQMLLLQVPPEHLHKIRHRKRT